MRLALYQPDMPQNTGTVLRLAACLGWPVEIIEPCGFVFDDRRLRRAGMDYLDHVAITRHPSWEAFQLWRGQRRVLLLTTRGQTIYTDHAYAPEDILLLGRESAGVPDEVLTSAEVTVRIPVRQGLRSLNVAVAAAMVAGEAARQSGLFKNMGSSDGR